MSLLMFSLPNGQNVMGNLLEETDSSLIVDFPINIVFENQMALNTAVYTSRYSPLAKGNIVTFFKRNVVSFSAIDDNLVKHYHTMVDYYKSKEFVFSSDREEKEEEQKIVHSKNTSKSLH